MTLLKAKQLFIVYSVVVLNSSFIHLSTMQLYYFPASPPSRAVLQTIRVLELDVEIKSVDLLKGENLSPEFLKLNPMHQIPVLIDDDFVLTESRAIMAYLMNSRAPGSTWYPNDPKERALIDRLLYFDCVNFHEPSVEVSVS